MAESCLEHSYSGGFASSMVDMSYSLNSLKGVIWEYYRGYEGRYWEFFEIAHMVRLLVGLNVNSLPELTWSLIQPL